MSEETVTPGNVTHLGEPLTLTRTGQCTWTAGNGITLTYRPNMIWAATAGPHTTIGATAQDALDSLTIHRRRTTGHEAALRRMSHGRLFARQMSRYLHIGPGSRRFRRPEGDLHKTIIRTAIEATRPAEHGLHPEHIETAARPAIGALLAWERHITGRQADARVLRHAHALGPRAVLGLLGDMVDAGVTTVDDGAAWFADMSHSLAPDDPRPARPGANTPRTP
ncbi:hypothetical protein ACFZBU_39455 [Embleya sp. NPDC008237]|uniref:hypothetical protein n=1 Tax=Embleya sp. NPDC008237 TaxID=3363978 RepID=UPI0036E887C7